MATRGRQRTGAVVWTDLTVPDAVKVRKFYEMVAGWQFTEFDMGGYSDFVMLAPDNREQVAGICHARGSNAQLPPYWLIYISVSSLDASTKACVEHGGKVLTSPQSLGEHGTFCVIQDPAGAVCALVEPPPAP